MPERLCPNSTLAGTSAILKPAELNVPADKFKAQFGLEWTDALATGRVVNAMDGCAALGIDADTVFEFGPKTVDYLERLDGLLGN